MRKSDVLSDQDPPKIPWAGDQCGKILIHSTPNVKGGEESFHRGDRALLETVKGWDGGGGWEASFIHFSGIHQPDCWTRILTFELSLAGNIRNTGLYHFWLRKESCRFKKKKKKQGHELEGDSSAKVLEFLLNARLGMHQWLRSDIRCWNGQAYGTSE